MTNIKPQPGILKIEPYKAGASKVEGVAEIVKLSANENPFGPGDAAIEAFRRAALSLHRYPGSDHASLRAAIGDQHGLDPERIICGAGSDEILSFLCQAYAGRGSQVIYTEHGFAMYRILAHAAGAKPVMVREKDRVVDVDAILKAVNGKTTLVFIANPGNPTGTMVPDKDLARLAAGLPDHVLLVLDGAYAEYVDGFDGSAKLVTRRDNVVMTRTFSKMYGLGGLRVGWAYGPGHVIDVLNRVRGPFNLAGPQLVTAEAAIRDQAHVEKCRLENTRMRDWITTALREKGLEVDDSSANFVLARFADQDTAEACDEHLKSVGLIVRRVGNYGFPNGLRITVGDEPASRRVVHAIGQFLDGRA
ncbi:MAG TPA: histidinol-phosphate transaminase [Aliiroseovarius sp.]|nr:histidinol-phosphate transaminase [Aliiroseovarius sp.]